jgi:anti-sigma factor RsiW
MEHFDITRWTDYVRGLCPPAEREALEHHLLEGCDSCARLMSLVGRIQQEAAAEVEVPEHMVIAAKAVFPARRASDSPAWMAFPLLAAQLLVESAAETAMEGARSASPAMLHAVYHAGDYAIELQIERDPESAEIALVGQVVHRAGSAEHSGRIELLLLARNKPVARTESNPFGEFCLTVREQQGLKLCVALEEIGQRVEIPLNRILADQR